MSDIFEQELARNPGDEDTILAFARKKGPDKGGVFVKHALPRLDADDAKYQKSYITWLLDRMVSEGKLSCVDNGRDTKWRMLIYGLPGKDLSFSRRAVTRQVSQ